VEVDEVAERHLAEAHPEDAEEDPGDRVVEDQADAEEVDVLHRDVQPTTFLWEKPVQVDAFH
jgi:hypothetical protein